MSLDGVARLDSPRKLGILLLALVAAACAPSRALRSLASSGGPARQAEDPDAGYRSEFYSRQGFHVAVRGHGARLWGDFDGDTALVGPDTIFIPDADEGTGYELAVGGMKEGDAYRLTYTRIDHDGSIGGADADVEYRAIGLEIVHYMRANEPVQPLFSLGLVYPFVDLEDASTDGVVVGDAKLRSGFGLSLGGGVAWWLTRGLALDLRAQYVLQWFYEAEGVAGDEDDVDDGVDASSYGISLGLTWVLGGRE